MSSAIEYSDIRAILLDIEGTTTPIDFVFKKLFPFASERVADFLHGRFHEPEIEELLIQLRESCEADAANGAPAWNEAATESKLASAARYVRWLIARDSKIMPLKTLEGKIWEQGFRSGELKGEVYSDVAQAFARWRSQGRRVAIFSSGSVLAQKLLFAHSTSGDLSSFPEARFDTTVGSKREAESYRKISLAIGLQPRQVLFVSDVGEELDAARSAGMKTAHSLRPGISPLSDRRHAEIRSFDEIFPVHTSNTGSRS